ncbi:MULTISPECIES: hypothetical protein [unclassified Streptomyces]|uniref:hypothetical protein n=1 Tax=unclassified Streptomyces TaxID=2593676 RepID=UPI002024AFB4|nr:hypothetical protein [Streptomyces sp. A 4/2]WSV55758.1 hypothetical protein OG282_19765 [Streptomyces sp. NBC_01014]
MIQPGSGAPPGAAPLRRYLRELVAHRAAPVHTAVAFNALYFGFDTEAGGYVGGPLDIGDFPSVALGDQVEALPVGAMINVRTGGDLLPAEVVYKEGAHPDLDNGGHTPGWLSGAPSGARGPGVRAVTETPSLRERLVFDTAAFGQGLATTAERLNRLSRRGTLDAYGHLVVDARYAGSEGDLDDASYYARYLMTRGREQLNSSLAPMPLRLMLSPDSSSEDLEAALIRLMSVIRQTLASLPEVRIWGDYAFTRVSMAARLADPGPVGRDALEALAQSVVRSAAPIGRRRSDHRKKTVYTALGPVLRTLPGASGLLRTTAYPLAISQANVLLADLLRGEADEETGLLPNGVRLSLDDCWQGGGVWRSEYAAEGGPAATPAVSPYDPAGRGWAESQPPVPPTPQPGGSGSPADASAGSAEPAAGEGGWPDDRRLGEPVRTADRPDRIEWTQPLRARHVSEGFLPLPEDVLAGLTRPGTAAGVPDEFVQISVRHDGHILPSSLSDQNARFDSECGLAEVLWPPGFFPGILLSLTWCRGSREIQVRTVRLPRPQTIDGQPVGHRYDKRVYTRDGAGGVHPHLTGSGTEVELLVMTAVRRLGLLDVYGRALLARDRLHSAVRLVMTDVLVHPGPPRVESALGRLLAAGRLTALRGSRSVDGLPHYPSKPGESALELVCYSPLVVEERPRGAGPDEPSGQGRSVNVHHVPGFLRFIGHLGYEASEEQRRLFRQDFRAFGLAGTPELPPGYTYVRPHQRGS